MDIKIIKTEKEYDAIMKRVLELAENNPGDGTPEMDELEILSLLIKDYDDKHYSDFSELDPVEAIKIRMEDMGLKAKDLVPYIGQLNRVYEVLNGKRSLSINMIKKLSKGLHIPADMLLGI